MGSTVRPAAGLFTLGHGTDGQDELAARLAAAGLDVLVDIRRFPGSRRHRAVGADALARWVPACGIDYRWEERLGGRRSVPRGTDPVDSWWRVRSFQAYAAHTRTAEFAEAFDGLVEQARTARVAVLCSEYVWWRCHRRLVADVAALTTDLPVHHLMPDGRSIRHEPAPGARVVGESVLWDGGTPAEARLD